MRDADQIAVMARCRLTVVGTHQELLTEPYYRALLRQSGQLVGEDANPATGNRAVFTEPEEEIDTQYPKEEQPVSDSPVGIRPAARSMLAHYHRLMTDGSWRKLLRGLGLGVVNGAVSGIALLVLLPISVCLPVGGTCWGLDLGGWLLA